MKLCVKVFFICLLCFNSSDLFARFYTNSAKECYVDDIGNDWFWFCGSQSQSCRGNPVTKSNRVHWIYHGGSFSYDGHGPYWCCDGTADGSGHFEESDTWIIKSETVVEQVGNGTCKWTRKTNICNQIDNPNDQCTEPNSCDEGYVFHNKKCVLPCQEGYAFESNASSNCIPCESNIHQGIVKGVCVRCEPNQIFDTNATTKTLNRTVGSGVLTHTISLQTTNYCVAKSAKVQVSILAHEACWLCSNPADLRKCLTSVANGGSVPADNTCALNPTEGNVSNASNVDRTNLVQKYNSSELKIKPQTLKEKAIESAKANPFKTK